MEKVGNGEDLYPLITHKQNNDWIHKIIWEYLSKQPLWAHHTNHYKLILNSNILSMAELLIHNIKMAQENSQITRGYLYKHALHICNIIRTDKTIQLPCISWTTQGTQLWSRYLCSWFSSVNPLVGFEPSIFELSIFIRGKGKNE